MGASLAVYGRRALPLTLPSDRLFQVPPPQRGRVVDLPLMTQQPGGEQVILLGASRERTEK